MEHVLADFSGGMNAVAAVDKLQPNECLLAENVRFDETGNMAVSGAYTAQNSSIYSDGTSNKVHSLYWNPSLGGVAGVGQDVFTGPTLGGLSDVLLGKNTNAQKMSFATAPNKVFFDVGSVGYFSDMTNLLKVDWAPPSASSAAAVTNTSATSGTFTKTSSALNAETFGFALNTLSAMQGIACSFIMTATATEVKDNENLTVYASLLVNGIPVGTKKALASFGLVADWPDGQVLNAGNANDLWGDASLTAAQVNAAGFGVQISYSITGSVTGINVQIGTVIVTAYTKGTGTVAGTGAAGTLTGTYTWRVTFVAASGEESDGSGDTASIILSAQQGTLTAIPTGDARTVSRNIYRKGGALTANYLVGSLADNVSTTFSDNQTDIAALAAGIILAGDVPGDFPNSRLGNQQVRFPAYHYDRVFWVIPGTNQIIWSKPLDGFAYPVVNFLSVGDSKPISRIVSIFGELIIIKTDSIWRLTGTDESSFDLSPTPSSVGTDEPFTVVALPDKIIFANRYNLWAFNGYTSVPLTNKLDLWFKQQDRSGVSLFGANGFHPPEITSAAVIANFDACGNAEKYYFAYSEATQVGPRLNNAVLVFDLKHENITKRPPGQSALSLAIDPLNGYVYMGDQTGFVTLLDDWNGANANSFPVNLDFQTGYQNFQRGSNQAFFAIEFYINTNGQSVTPFVYYDGGENSEQLVPLKTSSMQRVVRTLQATNARKAQSISIRLNASVATVNVNGTPQIILNSIKPYFQVYTGRARVGQ